MRQAGRYGGDRQQVMCFGCGELGHIRPNCPNKIRRVIEQDAGPGFTVEGYLAGVHAKGLKIDTGSGRTLVHQDFIPRAAYTGKTVRLDSWRGGQFSRHRLARIVIKIGEKEELVDVVAVDTLDCPALLGRDLGPEMTVSLLGMILEEVKASPDVNMVVPMQPEVIVNVVVPMQQDEDLVKVDEEQEASVVAQNKCDPLPFSGIFDFSDGFFEDDPLPGEKEECSVLVEEQCQIAEDQAGEFTFGRDDNVSLELGDVFDFSDDYFESDPVISSAEIVSPSDKKTGDFPLSKEDGLVLGSSWQSSELIDFDQRFTFYYDRATRGLAPIWVALIHFMLLLFLNVVLLALFLLTFSMFVVEFLLQHVVGAIGLCSLLGIQDDGKDLPMPVSASRFLPITGIGGGVFSSPDFRQPEGGGDVMRSLPQTGTRTS